MRLENWGRLIFKRLIFISVSLLIVNVNFLLAESLPSDPEKGNDGRPITEFLDEDGNFQNPDGYTGTIDLAGFTMNTAEDGTPMFINTGNTNDDWDLQSTFPGVNNSVSVLTTNGDDLYVGGSFTEAGGIPASRIARYNTVDNTWHALGEGLSRTSSSTEVYSIVAVGNQLYVGGRFNVAGETSVSNIARYDVDTGTWHSIDGGPNGRVYAIEVSGEDIFVGGSFTSTNGSTANRIARYNTSENEWYTMGEGVSGGSNVRVRDLVLDGNNLYVGGRFENAGGNPANYIARYNITENSWHPIGDGVEGPLSSLVMIGDQLYMGGNFTSASGVSANRVVRYNITENSWHPLGDGIPWTVNALATDGTDIYVGGDFTSAGGSPANRVARYNTAENSWHALGDGAGDRVDALAMIGNNLYVGGIGFGGGFTTIGGHEARGVARYDTEANTWHPLGDGINTLVRALAVDDNNLFIGGDFITAGGLIVNRIVRYNITGNSWHTMGEGVSGTVNSIAVIGDQVYVGGSFFSAGGNSSIRRIARYNIGTNTWCPLGDGVGGTVEVLMADGDQLYVGGSFSSAGGMTIRGIARYHTGTEEWFALGDGLNSAVRAIKKDGDNIYVGGSFTTTGLTSTGMSVNRVARYNVADNSWHALGDGVNSQVNALALDGDQLYVGGNFTSADGNQVNRIARYNTTENTWHSLGDGLDSIVRAMEVIGNQLFIGGDFTEAGGQEADRMVLYNTAENTWNILGDGTNDKVHALTLAGSNLYIGGDFTRAGNKPASRYGRWAGVIIPPGQVVLSEPDNGATSVARQPQLHWAADAEASSYQIQISLQSSFSSTVIDQNGLTTTTFIPSSPLQGLTKYFWRVRAINDGGFGEWSTGWSFTTQAVTPDQVTLSSPTNESTGVDPQTTFSWDAANHAQTYQIMISTSNDFSNPVVDESGLTTTTFTPPTELDRGITYYWQVRGINDGVEGPWSAGWSFTTAVNTPVQVVLDLPANEATGVDPKPTFSWETATHAQSYEIVISASENFSEPVVDQSGLSEITFTSATDLERGITYHWRVRGLNDSGEQGPWSATRSFTTVVAAPTQVALSSPDDGLGNVELTPTLSWIGQTVANQYRLQLSMDNNFNNLIIDQGELTEATFAVTSALARGINYFWRVQAIGPGGTGTWSETRSFTTIPNVPAQVALSAPDDGAGNTALQPQMSWAVAEGASTYELQISGDTGFSNLAYTQSSITTTSHTPSSVLNRAVNYFWRVRGINTGGEGPWSGARSFTTIPEVPAQVVLSSPGVGEELADEDLSPEFSWQQANGAEYYLLELSASNEVNFSEGLLFSSEPISETTFALPESVELEYATTYYWRVWAVNPGGNGPTGEIRSFTTGSVAPPQSMTLTIGPDGQIQISWDGSGSSPRVQFFDIFCGPTPWNLDFCERVDADQFGTNSQGSAMAKAPNLTSMESEYFAVQAVIDEDIKSALSDVVNIVDITGQIPDQWSLISLPVDDEGVEVEASALYSFSGNNYVKESMLAPGRAYWARSDDQESYTRRAPGLTRTSLELTSGWNLLGGLVAEVAVADIADPDSILGVTPVYSWSGDDYVPADTLAPFEGYWIYADSPGTIELRLRAEMAGQDDSGASVIVASSKSNNEQGQSGVYTGVAGSLAGTGQHDYKYPQNLIITSTDQNRSLQLYPRGLPDIQQRWLLPPRGPAGGMDLRTSEGLSAVGSPSEAIRLIGGD